jgi:hypothetical protein
VGDERKAREQFARGGQCLLEALHQERPVARGQAREPPALEGAVLDRPAIALAHDKPRGTQLAAGERNHRLQIEQALKARQRTAHQQGLLLPVAAKKGRRIQAAEKRCVHVRHLNPCVQGHGDARARGRAYCRF